MTTDELLAKEGEGWAALQARLERLGDRWLEPGVNGEWTAKDVLAHIADWHAWSAGILEERRKGGDPQRPTQEWVDARNAETFARARDASLDDVRKRSAEARAYFRSEVALCDPEASSRIVFGNAEGHYDEHIPQLDAFLGGK